MNKKILYFDMDNVLVDFPSGIVQLTQENLKEYDGRLDEVPGIFGLMKPLEGALDAFETLSKWCCQRNSSWSLSTTIRDHYEAQSWNHSERAEQRFCL